MITLDFETEAIEGSPLVNPPKPVGLAVRGASGRCHYQTDWDDMADVWEMYCASSKPLLFHNAPFDLSVGCHWFNTPWPAWERVHDTMYLLFLADPYAQSLSLKPSAERYLDEPPEEQNALYDWIVENIPEATRKNAGAFISRAPVEIVRPYAIGDVERTWNLYTHLMEKVDG